MAGTVAWLALAALALGWELACRLGPRRRPRLAQALALLATRLPGRLLLLLLWVFAGIHLFARRGAPVR